MEQSWLSLHWQALLLGAVIGLVIGFLIAWLRARSAAQGYEYYLSQNRTEIDGLKNNLSAISSERAELKAQVTAKNQQLDQLTVMQSELDANRAAYEAQLQELEQANLALQARTEQLQQANSGWKSRDEQLQQANAAWKARDAQLQQTVAEWKAQLEGQEQEKATLKQNLEGTLVELARIKEDNQALSQALANKDIALNEAYLRATTLQRQMIEAEEKATQSDAELSNLKRDVTSLSSVNQDLEAKLHNARGEVAGEMAVLTSTMARMKDDALAKANARIAALTNEVDALKKSKAAVG